MDGKLLIFKGKASLANTCCNHAVRNSRIPGENRLVFRMLFDGDCGKHL
jgi:hypothetical protein